MNGVVFLKSRYIPNSLNLKKVIEDSIITLLSNKVVGNYYYYYYNVKHRYNALHRIRQKARYIRDSVLSKIWYLSVISGFWRES